MKKLLLNSSMQIIINNKKLTEEELEIIKYGLEGIYLTFTKAIVIFSIAIVLGIFKEVFILLLCYNIIRNQAFGIHASKSIYCLISSLIIFIGGSLIIKYCFIPYYIKVILSCICDICLLLYAPADTYKRPLINAKKRKRFKICSVCLGLIYTILIIFFKNSFIVNYLLVGMLSAVIMILPLTYKIFKLPYNNYKTYNYNI